MKIVIADGLHEADYIIKSYMSRKNDLIIINEDLDACSYLSANNGISVMHGRSTRESDLREAGAENADLFIALSKNDMNNYVACKTAKKLLNVKRCIATVLNPKNVDVFKKLGIDSVSCSTYLLGEQIRNAGAIENMINTLSLDDNKIMIIEFRITEDLKVCDMTLKDLKISHLGSVSTITRGPQVIIPNGNTRLHPDDRVLIVTKEENKNAIFNFFKRKK